VLVDPKKPSRTCPKCLVTMKTNRQTRDLFRCVNCGWTAPADYVGALNIRGGPAFSLPIVASPQRAYEAAAISLPSGGIS
jgi:putative transposase